MNKNHAILYLFIENEDLKEKYKSSVEKHNNEINSSYPNAGFDLYFPEDSIIETHNVSFINMKIKCEMHIYSDKDWIPTSYYMYPRSSISKTPLMVANHTGIIDSGYRGNIIGAFRNLMDTYEIKKFNRLLQLCAPDLRPIHIEIVDNDDFFELTKRNIGGFGSTGL